MAKYAIDYQALTKYGMLNTPWTTCIEHGYQGNQVLDRQECHHIRQSCLQWMLFVLVCCNPWEKLFLWKAVQKPAIAEPKKSIKTSNLQNEGLPATGAIVLHSAEPVQADLAGTNGQSNPPAVHKTHIIMDNNNEAATKSTYLWNKSTILPVYPQIMAICGQIEVRGHNIVRIVADTMKVTRIGGEMACKK